MNQAIYSEEDIKHTLPRSEAQRGRAEEGVAIFAPHQRLIETPLLYIHPERSGVCKKNLPRRTRQRPQRGREF